MARSFAIRGVVEGFYGPCWAPTDRLEVVSFLAARGMNAYVYAPKDDEFHRSRWREPYDDSGSAMLRDLARHCTDRGVRFGFAVSPGLDIAYGDRNDIAPSRRASPPTCWPD